MFKLKKMCMDYKIYLILLIYCLFVFSSIKNKLMPRVDGIATNNVIIVTFLVFCIILRMHNFKVSKKQFCIYAIFCFFTLATGLLKVDNIPQFCYAFFQFFIPLLLLLIDSSQSRESFFSIIKIVNFIMVIYALLSIYVSLTFPEVYQNYGNTVGGLSRIPMPIGSSITLSYYMNISLPFALLLFLKESTKKGKIWYLFSTVVNISITCMQMSRSAAITSLVIVMYFIFFIKDTNSSKRKIILFITLLISAFYLFSKFDLSRLTISVFGNASGFDDARYNALDLSAHLFSNNVILGTGFGAYFHRAWLGNNHIIVDGVSGLIDPHNAFLLLLSEGGVVGFTLFFLLIWMKVKDVIRIEDCVIRRTGYLLFVALILNALAGSQIVNEINYICISFIYLLIFTGQTRRE